MGEASLWGVLGRSGVEVLLLLLFCGVRLRLGSSEATVVKGDASFEEGVRALATVLAEGMRCTSDVPDIVAILLLCLSVVSQLVGRDSLQQGMFSVEYVLEKNKSLSCEVFEAQTRQTVAVLTPLPHYQLPCNTPSHLHVHVHNADHAHGAVTISQPWLPRFRDWMPIWPLSYPTGASLQPSSQSQ